MKKRVQADYKAVTFNLETHQAQQLQALKLFTKLSLSDMARAAFRAYLASQAPKDQDVSLPRDNSQTR